MSKIDVTPIIAAHLKTLRDNRFGSSISRGDVLTFFISPALIGMSVLLCGFRFRSDAVSGILNAFSILTGLLLNLLVLVFTLAAATPPTNMDAQKRKTLLIEVFANVCFAIVVAIVVVCVTVVALSYMRSSPGAVTGVVATFVLVMLPVNFILTILMVIKRMYILLLKDIAKMPAQRNAA